MADGRIPALDGVRGLAVAAVVLFHVDVLGGGWVGVDVFFVLSGFLITSLLLGERQRTGRIGLRAFWKRRVRRLMPALLVVVTAVSTTWAVAGRVTGALRGDVLGTLAYVANWHAIRSGESYFASFEPSPLRHAWSLAIEEQFYVLWPLVVLVLVMLRPRWRLVGVAAAAGASAWWMHHVSADPAQLSRAYYGSDTRAATILVGCLAALALDATSRWPVVAATIRRRGGALVVVAVALLAGVAVAVPEDSRWLYRSGGFAAIAVVAGVLVVAAAHLPAIGTGRILAGPVLVRLGLISYSLYLWHWPVIVLLDGSGLPRLTRGAVAVAVSVALAELTFRVVERPLHRRRLPHPTFAVAGSLAVVVAVTIVATAGPTASAALPEATSGTMVARPPVLAPTSTSLPSTTSTSTSTSTTTSVPGTTTTRPPPPGLAALAATTTTTTTTTTVAPTTVPPPLELPLDVLVLGDSVAWVLAGNPAPDVPFLVRGAWHAKCDIVGRRLYTGDKVNEEDRDCPAWPSEWAAALETPPDAVVVVLGLRQLFDLDVEGERIPVGSPEWQLRYEEAVMAALTVVRERTRAPVVWLDVPCYDWTGAGTSGEERDAERLRVVNDVLRRTLAADPHVTVADYGARVCDGTTAIPELRPDGAHPTEGAAQDVWRWLGPQVLQAVETAR